MTQRWRQRIGVAVTFVDRILLVGRWALVAYFWMMTLILTCIFLDAARLGLINTRLKAYAAIGMCLLLWGSCWLNTKLMMKKQKLAATVERIYR